MATRVKRKWYSDWEQADWEQATKKGASLVGMLVPYEKAYCPFYFTGQGTRQARLTDKFEEYIGIECQKNLGIGDHMCECKLWKVKDECWKTYKETVLDNPPACWGDDVDAIRL